MFPRLKDNFTIVAGFPKLPRFISWEGNQNMNALTELQNISLIRPPRTAAHPIIIKIEVLGDVCLLHFKGRLQAGAHPDYLLAMMDEVKALASPKLLANLENVTSLDCSGLSFIVGLYWTSDGRLVLVKAQPRVREVLDITRLSTVIPLASDIESGLAALCGKGSAAGSAE
jgi:anti-anti-sigma factor